MGQIMKLTESMIDAALEYWYDTTTLEKLAGFLAPMGLGLLGFIWYACLR